MPQHAPPVAIGFVADPPPDLGVFVVPLEASGEGRGRLGATGRSLDRQAGGALSRLLTAIAPKGSVGEALETTLSIGRAATRIILFGIGAPSALTPASAEALGAHLVRALERLGVERATVAVDTPDGAGIDSVATALALAGGARLAAYRYDRLRTQPRDDDPSAVERLTFALARADEAEARWRDHLAEIEGALLARDLTNAPANLMTPDALAAAASSLQAQGLQVEILGRERLARIGAGALLAVGRESRFEPRLAVVGWHGPGVAADAAPVVLVGKGLTFDTGGITLKRPPGMDAMKADMAGAAAVLGAMRTLAVTDAPVRAVGVLAIAENMVGGAAFRPGDVVTAADGTTIEILDTDAEGRLALADALAWSVATLKPRAIVTIATLTGSIIRALGGRYAGLFATDEALASALRDAGAGLDEPLWRMPMDAWYRANLDSGIADIAQIASDEASADAIHAAVFLRHFAGEVAFAHIDTGRLTDPDRDRLLTRHGYTGFGSRLLARAVRKYAWG